MKILPIKTGWTVSHCKLYVLAMQRLTDDINKAYKKAGTRNYIPK